MDPTDFVALIPIAVPVVFSLFVWIAVYLATYRHFANMGGLQRVLLAALVATILAALIVVLGYVAMKYVFSNALAS